MQGPARRTRTARMIRTVFVSGVPRFAENDAKSCSPQNSCAARTMRSKSRGFDDVPGAAAFKRRKHGRVPNAVTIRFSLRGKSRVKRLGNKPAPHDADGWRQESVQRGDPPLRIVAAVRANRHARIAPAHGRPHRFGRRHARALASNKCAERPFPGGPESYCGSPGFAIRQTARRRRKRSA